MIRNKKQIVGITVALIAGCLAALCYRGNIIFVFPSANTQMPANAMPIAKKQVKLFFWRADSWKYEKSELMLGSDAAETIAALANKWLTLLDEEGVMTKKVMVPAVLMAVSGNQAYISFDRYPFDKESAAYDKWMWLEGLLKTLRENGVAVPRIYFKVQHKPLRDYHLDFSSPWPLSGFMHT